MANARNTNRYTHLWWAQVLTQLNATQRDETKMSVHVDFVVRFNWSLPRCQLLWVQYSFGKARLKLIWFRFVNVNLCSGKLIYMIMVLVFQWKGRFTFESPLPIEFDGLIGQKRSQSKLLEAFCYSTQFTFHQLHSWYFFFIRQSKSAPHSIRTIQLGINTLTNSKMFIELFFVTFFIDRNFFLLINTRTVVFPNRPLSVDITYEMNFFEWLASNRNESFFLTSHTNQPECQHFKHNVKINKFGVNVDGIQSGKTERSVVDNKNALFSLGSFFQWAKEKKNKQNGAILTFTKTPFRYTRNVDCSFDSAATFKLFFELALFVQLQCKTILHTPNNHTISLVILLFGLNDRALYDSF